MNHGITRGLEHNTASGLVYAAGLLFNSADGWLGVSVGPKFKNRMKKLKILTATLAVFATVSAANAANTINGSLWRVPEAVAQNAIPANVPGTTPDVTFQVNSPFNFNATSDTIGNWLGSSSAFNIVENTPGTLAFLMDDLTQGTLLDFQGFVSVVNGQTFTVTHDDGLSLIIGGLDLGFSPAPTPPITSTATYTGFTGTFPFELVYTECCGGPAVLQVDLPFSNTPVPEAGSTLAMLSGGFAIAVGLRKKLVR